MTNSLLPPNATPLERALEAGGARIVDVQPRPDIDDPMTCPAELLPWLAWGLSVDTWDADWSEADKRAAVAGSIELHRRKGTRRSVEMVLKRFDQLAWLVEWHAAKPRRPAHTFDVVVPMVVGGVAAGGRRSTAAFADAIIREISRVKPLREHMRLVQQIDAIGSLGLQGTIRALLYTREDAELTIDTSPRWDGYLQTEDGEPIEDGITGTFLDTTP